MSRSFLEKNKNMCHCESKERGNLGWFYEIASSNFNINSPALPFGSLCLIVLRIKIVHWTFFILLDGRKDGIWTHDPYVPNVVLYQAEPPSDAFYYTKYPLKTQDFLRT